jgi:uncharacterized protein YegJ (DUF2314 family)
MKPFPLLLTAILFTLASVSGCDSTPETLVEGGYDQQEMDAAIARARGEVDKFIAELANPTGKDHAVKAPISEGETTEHFWLSDVTYADGHFEGTIGNDPGMVKNVKIGQKWRLKKDEISDWMFMRDGKMHGNYTMRPLLKTLPADEAAELRSILAEP